MSFIHGQSSKKNVTSEYRTWASMLSRCNNVNHLQYINYGERGIKACDRWHDFRNFYVDMGPRPDGLTLERRDNNKGYEPDNCCWATRKEQRTNTRPMSCGPHKQRWFYGHGPNGEMIIENNQGHVARVFSLNRHHVSNNLNLRLTQHKGWKFQWVEKEGVSLT